jgi:methyl coenzyme M reductase subunit D
MISGQMFYHKDTKKSLADTIKFLTELHQLENIKYVLVHPDSLDKEIITNNPKIKPKREVLRHHFWFISENNIENRPKYGNFEK